MCLCLNTVTLDRAIEFVTGIRPSRMFYFWGKKCGSSAKVTISLFWWPKSWSHRCQHMWIIILSAPLTFMHSNNFSFSSSFPSFAPLPPLTCPPSHSPLSPASPPPRLTGGQALPKSRECCPRLGLGFGLLLPHPPLFKHLPASENIPHCLSLRGGAGYFSKCINSKRATKGQNINIGKIPNGLQILYSCVSSFKVQNCLHVSFLAEIAKSKCRHLPTKSTSSCALVLLFLAIFVQIFEANFGQTSGRIPWEVL